MHDITKGVLAGAGLILLLAVLFKAELLLPQPAASAPIKIDVLTIGPDGKPDSAYGDELENVEVPGSADYQLCTVSEVMVKRPPMFTSDIRTPTVGSRAATAANGSSAPAAGRNVGCPASRSAGNSWA